MARPRRLKTTLHQDEVSSVEAHSQTVHKLVLVNDYGGACCGIIAQQARSRGMRTMHLTLVDIYAGAGQHQSVTDPDGVRKGTGLIFTTIGRNIQRAHLTALAHVRLNDLDPGSVERLRERVGHYRSGSSPRDCVDVVVTEGDAAIEILKIAREAAGRGGFSFIFVDPFGRPPAFATLDSTGRIAGWHEMLINFDASGVFRIGRAALTDASSAAADEAIMNGLFGDESWRAICTDGPTSIVDVHERLARAYADRFGRYTVRDIYRLLSSDGQVRFMVHLANHAKARSEFRKSYDRSLTAAGLFHGKRLGEGDRAKIALALFEQLRGTKTSVEDVYEAGLAGVDRGQLRHVFREAEERGCGRLEGEVMEWYVERLALAPFQPVQQLDFGLGA